ncbi:NUDIX hydrolase [Marivirga atlantica]|jgi:8-oxo-dGTP diphosphatase|uniref:NUDIX domain-containing protein n=1 Tax=Marivirga atlantica TaxID=1548457 RepID=A0A937AIS1_9BACT|nr:NUDIX domain-containing protein [Marivirga atlantica]MBL0766284.1 NUDIX domain-containing protein [Marivirga atlantica]
MSLKAKSSVNDKFGGNVRVRVVGILIENNKILLLKHMGVGSDDYLWSPPGGGLEFGTDAKMNLVREFKEETHLKVKVKELLFINEFMDNHIHAIELFYEVEKIGGILKLGNDPEMGNEQILTDLAFFGEKELQNEHKSRLHNMFHAINKPLEVLNLKGYFKFVINSIK